MDSTAASDRTMLGRSSWPGLGSRNSGSSLGPTASSTAITGTASRNTDPHQNHCSSIPPSSGPTAPPAEKLVIQTEIASARCLGSRRSEEHTSELQSRRDLVCRLLLEKKK